MATRNEVYAALWKDPAFLRLEEEKDAALKAWNRLDAYKNHPRLAEPEKLRLANASVDRALQAFNEYEERALRGATADLPVKKARKSRGSAERDLLRSMGIKK